MISMPVTELANLIEIAVDKVLDKRFSPLRRQFEDRLITLKEAAQKLGVTDRTMNNLEKRGELIPTRKMCIRDRVYVINFFFDSFKVV